MTSTIFITWKLSFLVIFVLASFYLASAQLLVSQPISFATLAILKETTIKDIIESANTPTGSFMQSDMMGKLSSHAYTKIRITEKLKEDVESNGLSSAFAQNSSADKSILVVSSSSNKFSSYPTEILTAEGLNGYSSLDISGINISVLEAYDVVIVGSIPLKDAQVSMLSTWTNAGGTLITLKPDPKLAQLLGITPTGSTLANKYLLVNTTIGPGKGIVDQTIQYQGVADLYNLNGATSVARLYSGSNTSTNYPAVTMLKVGEQGGTAVAFTFDLARSIVYTRQGNPEWTGQKRDGQSGPIRSDDQFYPDWVDLSKVMIPQADELQRLLANIITLNARKPVPCFWYFPRGLKAAVVMTGDDHGNGGTKARFNQYLQLSTDNSTEAVADWRAIRGTSYIYPNTPLTDAEAKAFVQQGFEIALHLTTNCENFTPMSLEQDLTNQLAEFKYKYPSVASPSTNRTHCIAWSDWHTQPKLEAPKGIRLDANYYYWPSPWVQNKPGMFTGSGIPMRFTDLDGQLIDCYQLTTQMTDESDQVFPYTIDQLLDKALGSEGYYGVFCANMHTDAPYSDGSDKIIASAKARNVPVISSKQLLTWLDGRNGSTFGSMSWSESELSFRVNVESGAHSLQGMLPITEATGSLVNLTRNGVIVPIIKTEFIKGVEYAFFPASSGDYVASYDKDAPVNQPPVVSITTPANNATFIAPASIIITANASDTDGVVSRVEFFNGDQKIGEDVEGNDGWSYTWNEVTANTYTLTAKATDDKSSVATSSAVNITVTAGPVVCPCTVFKPTDAPTNVLFNDGQPIQVGMKFRASTNGYVTGVRFYKQSGNTGTHTGQLYSSRGTLLASVMFNNETASGWQQAAFSTPVAITAGTTYVISYHSSSGGYSANNPFFTQAVENGPLRALASGEDGPNGVYKYSTNPAFPDEYFLSANYWVDIVFSPDDAPVNQPPVVSMTAPANNATFTAPATITLTADASDTDGTVSKVEFFQGTTKLGEDTDGGNGWSFAWDEVPAGSYTLTARATDDQEAMTTSSAVTITVNTPANQPPVVAISSPTEGASFTSPASIKIVAAASDPDGTVSKVELYNGENRLGEATSSPFEYTWTSVGAGTYQLLARATDNSGAVTNSEVVNVSVTAPENRPPVVANPIVDQASVVGVAFSFTFDLNTFTDPDEDPLTYTSSLTDGAMLPAWLVFNGSTRTFSGTPPTGSQGLLSIRIMASDGRGGTASDDFNLTISQPANQAPVLASIGNKSVNELSQLSFVASATDDGLPNNSLSYSMISPVTEASINPSTGAFSWTPTEAQGPGSYTFTIRVSDGELSDEEVITLQVAEVNQAPVLATVGNKEIGVGQTLLFTLQGSDADIPAQTLTYSANKLPAGAMLNANTGEFSWAPTSRQVGSHKIIFRVSDGIAQVNESITITVKSTPVASAPVIASFSPTSGKVGDQVVISGSNLTGASAVAFNGVLALIRDNSASSITVDVPAGATTGKISVSTPGGTVFSEASFTVTGETSGILPYVSITSPANSSSYTAPASITISATASDPDGSVVRVEFFQGNTKLGEGTNGADGWSLVWNNVAAGSYALTARATDNTGLSATSEPINISVTSISTSPPLVASFSPTSGPIGESVLISGNNLSTANKVTFGPSNANFIVDGNGNLIAKVPAVNGKLPSSVKITVTTPSGNNTTSDKFTITSGMAASVVSSLQKADVEEREGLIVYPNPFSDKATISFTLQEDSDYYVRLYDNKGALVAVLKHGYAKAGEQYDVEVDGSKQARGLYLVRLQTDAGSKTVKLILDR